MRTFIIGSILLLLSWIDGITFVITGKEYTVNNQVIFCLLGMGIILAVMQDVRELTK